MFYFHASSYVTFRTHVNTSYILCSGRATYLFVHRSRSLSLFFSTSSHLSLFLHCDATRNGSITASMTQRWKGLCSGVSESRKNALGWFVKTYNFTEICHGAWKEKIWSGMLKNELDKYTCMQRGKISKLCFV